MLFHSVKILGYNIFSESLSDIGLSNRPCIINTLNAYSYALAKKDKLFSKALETSDILLPDGFPVVMAAKILKKVHIKKIAGADVFKHLCEQLNIVSGSCLFLGSSETTLNAIKQKISIQYPQIHASFHSPPFKPVFSAEENATMIKAVNSYAPDVVFVGMTAPKQEKWVAENRSHINPCIIVSIGAVFDFYAGTQPRPSAIWIKLNLEWLGRLLKEPKRLWKRYLIYSPVFFLDVIWHMIVKPENNHVA